LKDFALLWVAVLVTAAERKPIFVASPIQHPVGPLHCHCNVMYFISGGEVMSVQNHIVWSTQPSALHFERI